MHLIGNARIQQGVQTRLMQKEMQIREKIKMAFAMHVFSPLQLDLLRLLETNGPMPRSKLVQLVSVPRTTLYDNLVFLIDYYLVERYTPKHTRPRKGRPVVFFKRFDLNDLASRLMRERRS